MPGLAPPNTAAGVNPEAGGVDVGGPGRAIALASVAPSAMESGSCASRGRLAYAYSALTELLSYSAQYCYHGVLSVVQQKNALVDCRASFMDEQPNNNIGHSLVTYW